MDSSSQKNPRLGGVIVFSMTAIAHPANNYRMKTLCTDLQLTLN